MKIAYLECATGISGDMTLAALLDAGVDEAALRRGIDSLGLEGVSLHVEETMRSCFRAKTVRVVHPEQHAHRHLADIVSLIDRAEALTSRARQTAKEIFCEIAVAEARVHGTSVEKIHFHEVGAIDSIVDIVAAAIGFDLLGVDQVVCAPLPPGRGQVRIAHGLCQVPTPGTAELLRGLPLCDVAIDAELTTPTGAAIVRVLVDRFGPLPSMTIDRVGYGAGTKDFPDRANILRLFVGQTTVSFGSDLVTLLETNLDDVSGEVIGYTIDELQTAGALDVFTIPVQMKKQRPGVIISVLCRPEDADALEAILFRETGTLGIRRQLIERSVRARRPHTVITDFGPIMGKLAWSSDGVAEFSPEFGDCALVANETGRSLREVYRAAIIAFDAVQGDSCTRASQPDIEQPAADHDHRHDHDHDHDHRHDQGHNA